MGWAHSVKTGVAKVGMDSLCGCGGGRGRYIPGRDQHGMGNLWGWGVGGRVSYRPV